MSSALCVDLGSTFTKLLLVDLDSGDVVARAQAPSTVDTDVAQGLRRGLRLLADQVGDGAVTAARPRLACSSAAGGLRMVAIGLVRELTAEAAIRAALGAGARLVSVHSGRLTSEECRSIADSAPDIVLLSGGTDGGERRTLVANARLLARAGLACPVVVAGNKEAAQSAARALRRVGREAVVTENVLPELDRLRVEPAQAAIRDLFLRRIVFAKGLDRVGEDLDGVLMPTPSAVLAAAELLAGELGELMVVDVGGATTDVHSVAEGAPVDRRVIRRGVPEPRVKRTVEADLGLRVSAQSLWEAKSLDDDGYPPDAEARIADYVKDTGLLPEDDAGRRLDDFLASLAIRIAVERHCGNLTELATPTGPVLVQRGKDLSGLPVLVGTGGILRATRRPEAVLASAMSAGGSPGPGAELSLKPRHPNLWIDAKYALWAVGLLASEWPATALALARRSLRRQSPTRGGTESRRARR